MLSATARMWGVFSKQLKQENVSDGGCKFLEFSGVIIHKNFFTAEVAEDAEEEKLFKAEGTEG